MERIRPITPAWEGRSASPDWPRQPHPEEPVPPAEGETAGSEEDELVRTDAAQPPSEPLIPRPGSRLAPREWQPASTDWQTAVNKQHQPPPSEESVA